MATEVKQDAIALLKADHRKVEDLFEAFEKASGAERKQKLVQQICLELKIHTTLEEEIFYPSLEGKIEQDMLDEAYVEHDAAKILVNELADAAPDEEYYDAKVKVLQEEIEHHVKEEEHPAEGMFAKARASDADMDALGEQMADLKARLKLLAESEGLPPAQTTTMGAEQPGA